MRTHVNRTNLILFVALIFATSSPASAQSAEEVLRPFVSDQINAVSIIDLSKADLEAAEREVAASPRARKEPDVLSLAAAAKGDLEALTALGVKYILWLYPVDHAPLMVAPMPPQADARKVLAYFEPDKPLRISRHQVRNIHGAVVQGTVEALDWLQKAEATPRPELKAALVEAAQAPIRIALIPPDGSSADQRAWGSVAVNLPPERGTRIVMMLDNGYPAAHLTALLDQTSGWIAQHPSWALLASPQSFALRLDIESQHNLRQILMGIIFFASENAGELPGSFDEIWQVMGHRPGVVPNVAINPWRPTRKIGFVYLQPNVTIGKIRDAQNRMVAYEAHDQLPPKINVGFMDGRTESVSAERFQQLLQQATDAGWMKVTE